MTVDTSAVIAVAFDEADAVRYVAAMLEARTSRISAANYVEASVVIRRFQGPASIPDLDAILSQCGVEIEDFTAAQAQLARLAYERYGRGSGHRARLNLGDCFAYALAKATGEPLLYKGSDFSHTDIGSALARR